MPPTETENKPKSFIILVREVLLSDLGIKDVQAEMRKLTPEDRDTLRAWLEAEGYKVKD